MSGVLMADDHLNLKAAPDGRVYAAVKTSRNDALAPNAGRPHRSSCSSGRPTASGISTTFDTVASADTRSQIVLDPSRASSTSSRRTRRAATTSPAAGSTARPRASMRRSSPPAVARRSSS